MNGLSDEAREQYQKGLKAIEQGKILEALALVEKALIKEPENPRYQSLFGLCISKERGQITEAIDICERSLKAEPDFIEHYIYLGQVYKRAGLSRDAIDVIRKGLKIDRKHPGLIAEIETFGLRKNPVISYLSRNNVLNKYLGIIFSRLGFR
jgi:tetratricopeptide (TPR) repeat protein